MVNAMHRGAGRGRYRLAALTATILTACFAGLALGGDAAAAAKKTKKAAEEQPAQKDTAAIQRAYAAGTKAYETGDMAGAEQQLSVALAGGGLPNAQMARALYLRGAAFRRLGRPAQAISDLTTAVWLKGGLSDTDKAKATEERQLAYREAGLGDQAPPIGAAPLDQSTKTASAPTPTPASGAQVVQVTKQSWWDGISVPSISMPSLTGSSSPQPAPAAMTQTADNSGSEGGFWSFLSPSPSPSQTSEGQSATLVAGMAPGASAGTPVAGTEVQAANPAFVAEAPPPQTSSWETQTADASVAAQGAGAPVSAAPVSDAYVPPPAAAPDAGLNPLAATSNPAPPQAPVSNPIEGAGTAVTNFFGNMFGSGSTQAAPPAVTTGSTEQAATWSADNTVVTAQTSSMVQRSPDSPPPAEPQELPWGSAEASAPPPAQPTKVATAAPVAAAGKYKLQVAAVRSRDEAERLAQSLSGFQPVRDGSVAPEIDETVIGSMGTFYRVRLGPYANAKEPDQLCAALKPQGFDCMVVTQ
ncbi:MAG: SPOR domain-containing protein [Hyphomicrobium sp.]|uniref:SPOR domain-containing protein n=1 Tax=Hyphomicrobium sp. TaxID=82 RepID=UPI003D0B77ED